jgi:quercetin dioxygenase-like cupin family protein
MDGMEQMNRRDLCAALSAFAALGGVISPARAEGLGAAAEETVLSRSESFPFDQLPVSRTSNGGAFRKVISGTLVTGEFIEVHETTLPPGQMPHPPHRHRNSELLCIREGDLEYLNDGKPERVGPGGVVFTASNVLHGLKNIGSTPATYFVIAIGRATKES